jgi:hypothetical protein
VGCQQSEYTYLLRGIHTEERVLQAQQRVSLRSGHFENMFNWEKVKLRGSKGEEK